MKVFVSLSGRDILYHLTKSKSLLNILKNNKFRLTLAAQNEEKYNRRKFYYMSFARSPFGSFSRDVEADKCQIVLDGRKLSNRYSIKPVNFFPSFYRQEDPQKKRNGRTSGI